MILRLFVAFCALLSLAACAQVTRTSGAGVVDPGYHGAVFSSLVIDARAGMAERDAIERSAAAEASRIGVTAYPSIDIVPPTRDKGEAQRRRDIMNTGAAAVLEIHPLQKQIVRDYIEGNHRYYRRHWDRHRWHDRYYDPFYYDEPPLILEEPEARYEAVLYTLPHYNKAWAGEFTTRGPTGMSFVSVGANFGREIIERLAAGGMMGIAPMQ